MTNLILFCVIAIVTLQTRATFTDFIRFAIFIEMNYIPTDFKIENDLDVSRQTKVFSKCQCIFWLLLRQLPH